MTRTSLCEPLSELENATNRPRYVTQDDETPKSCGAVSGKLVVVEVESPASIVWFTWKATMCSAAIARNPSIFELNRRAARRFHQPGDRPR